MVHFQCQKGMKTEVGHWLEISRIHITAQQVLDLNPFSLFPPALWQSLISTRVSPVQVHINKIPVRIQVECLLPTDHIVPCLVNHQAAVYSTGPICLSHPCHIMGVGPGLHMAISWPRLCYVFSPFSLFSRLSPKRPFACQHELILSC